MDLNLTQLKDLEFICEMAATLAEKESMPEWKRRAERYRWMFYEEATRWPHLEGPTSHLVKPK